MNDHTHLHRLKARIAGFQMVKCRMGHESIECDPGSGLPFLDALTPHGFQRKSICSEETRSPRLACAHTTARVELANLLDELLQFDVSATREVEKWKEEISSIDGRIREIDQRKSDAEVERASLLAEGSADARDSNAHRRAAAEGQHDKCVDDLNDLVGRITSWIEIQERVPAQGHTTQRQVPFMRLPFSMLPEQLAADLDTVQEDDWITHFRAEHFRGDWEVAPLRSVAGHPQVIYSTPSHGPDFYQDTPILKRMAFIPGFLAQFECQVNAVRLMKLGPQSEILEHTDDLGDAPHEIRLHVPVRTHSEVEFCVAGRAVPMEVGELWFARFELPHRVINRGSSDRVHLVIDCVEDEWLLNLIGRHEDGS